jgi:hypothetical protein
MSGSDYCNTAFDTAYGVKASNGTMGILCRGTEVLIIHRRLKTNEISENGPPGKHMPRLTATLPGEFELTCRYRHLGLSRWRPGPR